MKNEKTHTQGKWGFRGFTVCGVRVTKYNKGILVKAEEEPSCQNCVRVIRRENGGMY